MTCRLAHIAGPLHYRLPESSASGFVAGRLQKNHVRFASARFMWYSNVQEVEVRWRSFVGDDLMQSTCLVHDFGKAMVIQ
jgi:hypothetical protein